MSDRKEKTPHKTLKSVCKLQSIVKPALNDKNIETAVLFFTTYLQRTSMLINNTQFQYCTKTKTIHHEDALNA